MKYKVMRNLGILLMVLGLFTIIVNLASQEKSVVRSLASGGSPIAIGAALIGVSSMLERKNSRADTPKG